MNTIATEEQQGEEEDSMVDEEEEFEESEAEEDQAAEGSAKAEDVTELPPPQDSESLHDTSREDQDTQSGRCSLHEEVYEEPEMSPPSRSRRLSRSPPASRHSSSSHSDASSLANAAAELSLTDTAHRPTTKSNDISEKALADVTKQRARQHRKYHAKKGARTAGRPKGSKAKSDGRIRVDSGGFWG